ncbi:MAG: O-antigen ligase family protein [Candidatus Sabulitectum sp.]|nr:O-antigen ligase family protein [Candidatus Sabulitectum sp.]
MIRLSEDNRQTELEPYKPSWKTLFLVSGLTLAYFYFFFNFPRPVLVLLVGIPVLFFFILHNPNPRTWVLLLPFVVTYGDITLNYGPFYIAVATLAVQASFLLYLVVKLAGFRSFPRFPIVVYLVFAAFLMQLVSMFISMHYTNSLTGNIIRDANKIYLSALLIPVIYDWFGRGEWLVRMLKMLTIMLIIMSLYGLYQYYSGNLDNSGERASGFDLAGRIYSSFGGGSNSYSGVLELMIPTALASMFFFKKKSWKIIALAATMLGFQNVLFTFSRGGFLTASLATLAYLIYRYRNKIWVPILAFSILAGGLLLNAEEFKRQLTIFGDTQSLMLDTSLLHRYTSYMGFANSIKESPVVGVGWGSREFYHGRTALYAFWEVRHEDSIEKITRFGGLNSTFLEMPYKGGLFSAISLLLLLMAFIFTSFKLLRSGTDKSLGMGLVCGLSAFWAHQVFDNLTQWPQTGAFFWLIFALLISIAYPCCGKEVDSL